MICIKEFINVDDTIRFLIVIKCSNFRASDGEKKL